MSFSRNIVSPNNITICLRARHVCSITIYNSFQAKNLALNSNNSTNFISNIGCHGWTYLWLGGQADDLICNQHNTFQTQLWTERTKLTKRLLFGTRGERASFPNELQAETKKGRNWNGPSVSPTPTPWTKQVEKACEERVVQPIVVASLHPPFARRSAGRRTPAQNEFYSVRKIRTGIWWQVGGKISRMCVTVLVCSTGGSKYCYLIQQRSSVENVANLSFNEHHVSAVTTFDGINYKSMAFLHLCKRLRRWACLSDCSFPGQSNCCQFNQFSLLMIG